jgi:hypothetical protein
MNGISKLRLGISRKSGTCNARLCDDISYQVGLSHHQVRLVRRCNTQRPCRRRHQVLAGNCGALYPWSQDIKSVGGRAEHSNIGTNVDTTSQKLSLIPDVCLFKVFQLGLTTLKQLQTSAIGECPFRSNSAGSLIFNRTWILYCLLSLCFTVANPQQQAILGDQTLSLIVRCLDLISSGQIPMNRLKMLGRFKLLRRGGQSCKIQRRPTCYLISTQRQIRQDPPRPWKLSFSFRQFDVPCFLPIKIGRSSLDG